MTNTYFYLIQSTSASKEIIFSNYLLQSTKIDFLENIHDILIEGGCFRVCSPKHHKIYITQHHLYSIDFEEYLSIQTNIYFIKSLKIIANIKKIACFEMFSNNNSQSIIK